MADPKNPLVTSIATNPSPKFDYMQDNSKIPTVFAVNQLLAGMATGGGTSGNGLSYTAANQVKYCGVYHFTAGGLADIPAEITSGGMLVVYNERESDADIANHAPDFGDTVEAKTGYDGHVFVRQVIWPDGPSFITPFTRTGIYVGKNFNNTDKTYDSVDTDGYGWTAWQTLGGGLRRVKMETSIPATEARSNVLYYSFGAYTLNLPDPVTCTPGTKIGLEQYVDGGKVTYTSNNVTTTLDVYPAHMANPDGSESTTILGPNVYIFESIRNTNGVAEWILDVDNNINATIETAINGLKDVLDATSLAWNTALNVERDEREAADIEEADKRLEADTGIYNLIGKDTGYFNTTNTGTVAAKVKANEDDIDSINGRIGTGFTTSETVAKHISDIEAEIGTGFSSSNTITAKTTELTNSINDINNNKLPLKGRAVKVYSRGSTISPSTTGFDGPDGKSYTFTNALKAFDMIIVLTASVTVTLPAATSLPAGAKCQLEVRTNGHSVTLVDSADSSRESFTNDTGHILLLPLEVTIGSSGNVWSLTVAG